MIKADMPIQLIIVLRSGFRNTATNLCIAQYINPMDREYWVYCCAKISILSCGANIFVPMKITVTRRMVPNCRPVIENKRLDFLGTLANLPVRLPVVMCSSFIVTHLCTWMDHKAHRQGRFCNHTSVILQR